GLRPHARSEAGARPPRLPPGGAGLRLSAVVGALLVPAPGGRRLPLHEPVQPQGALPLRANAGRLPGNLRRQGVRPRHPQHVPRLRGHGGRRHRGRGAGRVRLRPHRVSRPARPVRADRGDLHGPVRGDRDPALRPDGEPGLDRHLRRLDRARRRQRGGDLPLPPVLRRDPAGPGGRRTARRRRLAHRARPDLPAALQTGGDRGVAPAVPVPVGIVPLAVDRRAVGAVQGGAGRPRRLPTPVSDALGPALRGLGGRGGDPAAHPVAAPGLLCSQPGRYGHQV
ncbi:MAG: hypothetical protein AVDCRST_MAG19-196, partial [uncultured Thermomicrobiales bacterium]